MLGIFSCACWSSTFPLWENINSVFLLIVYLGCLVFLILSRLSYLYMLDEVKVKVTQSCLTLCDPMDYTVHGIFQAKILEWVTVPFSRRSSQPRHQTQFSHIAGGFFRAKPPGKPKNTGVGSLSDGGLTLVVSRCHFQGRRDWQGGRGKPRCHLEIFLCSLLCTASEWLWGCGSAACVCVYNAQVVFGQLAFPKHFGRHISVLWVVNLLCRMYFQTSTY